MLYVDTLASACAGAAPNGCGPPADGRRAATGATAPRHTVRDGGGTASGVIP
ncbi:hypothetical protein [Streptomyces yaizuensis]|uniref:Uncharacterized protein n=1 Tax=Streptomyces yaizuensis TaxID=2989713 RepID=A0ABQ5P9K6_9ACTN|nr:hypothetical protein [Streptomyces sp. YSPA8]GLF99173.1 hypothetical protein SYYSPA8_32770 [Streptomyces sp. YSPA8]